MKNRAFVEVVASAVVVVFAIGIWSTGTQVNPDWLRFYSYAVTLAVLVLWFWDICLWKWGFVQRLRVAPRNLSGTWKGMLTSFWKDPLTGLSPDPKPVYLVVRQTFSNVSVILLTDESRSVSSLAIVISKDGTASLDYLYLNRPDSRVENHSRMHHGSASIDITGIPPSRLRGRYWTDRDSKGEFDFTERHRNTAEDYEDAARLFEAHY